jgi:trehalose-6-phosphate synthase
MFKKQSSRPKLIIGSYLLPVGFIIKNVDKSLEIVRNDMTSSYRLIDLKREHNFVWIGYPLILDENKSPELDYSTTNSEKYNLTSKLRTKLDFVPLFEDKFEYKMFINYCYHVLWPVLNNFREKV